MKNYCMIVDDNALVRETTAMVVKHIAGCPVRCCSNGQEALRVFEEEPDAFRCVITDLNMPGISGLELGARLRALAPDVKLLLMTGNPGAIDESTMRDHGFHGLLLKPFTLSLLREAIQSFFPLPGNDVPAAALRESFPGRFIFFEKIGGLNRAVA